MRVLIVDPAAYSPPYDRCIADSLTAEGASVKLLMPNPSAAMWSDPDALPPPPENWVKERARAIQKVGQYLLTLARALHVIWSWKPKIVHLQWMPLPVVDGIFVLLARKRARVVFTMHNVASTHEPRRGLRGLFRRSAQSLFDSVVVHSEYSAKSARHQYVELSTKLRVVHHGVLDHYSRLTEKSRRVENPVQLLFFGSIKRYKGLEILIEAIGRLDDLMPESSWKLVIAGSPSYDLSKIRERASVLGLNERIEWCLRHLSEREIADLLATSDVVLLPYLDIDQSGVLLAAIGAKRAVIASSVGAFPEVIQDGVHGILVSPGDVGQLASALARMISRPELRHTIEENLKDKADELSWSTAAKKTLAMYREVTDEAEWVR